MGQEHQQSRRNSFLFPMLCRLSTKDVRFSRKDDRSGDPSSPKVSCMGQVRRKSRVTGFTARTNANVQHSHNPTKLITMFSSRTLVPPSAASNAFFSSGGRRSGSRSCRTSREVIGLSNLRMAHLKKYDRDDFCDPDCAEAVIDVGEMDPPLPVLKRGGGVDEVNIWKRRFNGVMLERLQMDQIQLSKSRFLPPTTV